MTQTILLYQCALAIPGVVLFGFMIYGIIPEEFSRVSHAETARWKLFCRIWIATSIAWAIGACWLWPLRELLMIGMCWAIVAAMLALS